MSAPKECCCECGREIAAWEFDVGLAVADAAIACDLGGYFEEVYAYHNYECWAARAGEPLPEATT